MPRTQKHTNKAIHSKNLYSYKLKYNALSNLGINEPLFGSNKGVGDFLAASHCVRRPKGGWQLRFKINQAKSFKVLKQKGLQFRIEKGQCLKIVAANC
jgi:hypothetical protein